MTGRTGTLFTLTVFNASLDDEGLYQCVMDRDYGDVILREAVLLVDLEGERRASNRERGRRVGFKGILL